MSKSCWPDKSFYGVSTLSERGQIVIPAEARAELGFSPGEKLMIMRHPIHEGIVLFKLSAVQQFITDFQAQVQEMAAFVDESKETNQGEN